VKLVHSPPSVEVKKGELLPLLPHTSSWHSAKYRDSFTDFRESSPVEVARKHDIRKTGSMPEGGFSTAYKRQHFA
jgi:hypothetical protein